MSHRKARLTWTLLLFLFTSHRIEAQPDRTAPEGRQEAGDPNSIDRRALKIAYYVPEIDPSQLGVFENAANGLFGRIFRVEGEVGNNRVNIKLVGHALAVIDEPGRVEAILRELPALEKSAFKSTRPSSDAGSQELDVRCFEVEESTRTAALQVLDVLERRIGMRSNGEPISNVASGSGSGTIVVRDTPENLRRAENLLEKTGFRRPSPPPQSKPMILTCELLGSGELGSKAGEPDAEVTKHLSKLLPQFRFGQVAMAMAQVSSHSRRISLALDGGDAIHGELMLEKCAYDSAKNAFTIEELTLKLDRKNQSGPSAPLMMRTRAEIGIGENVVIGAIGREPFVILIRIRPA